MIFATREEEEEEEEEGRKNWIQFRYWAKIVRKEDFIKKSSLVENIRKFCVKSFLVVIRFGCTNSCFCKGEGMESIVSRPPV